MTGCGRFGFDEIVADSEPRKPFGEPTQVTELHSPIAGEDEEDPSLTGDMLEIVFERQGKLMTARRATIDAPFAPPAEIVQLEIDAYQSTPEISYDGLTLVFESGSTEAGDIYLATRPDRDSSWSTPRQIATLSSAASDEGAVTTEDRRLAVFASTRGGDDLDLYGAYGNGDGMMWDAPYPIAELNSAGDDLAPFIHDATQTLYFASSRDPSSDKDLFVARFDDLTFSEPLPLTELNTAARESDPWVAPDGNTIFFARSVGGASVIFFATR